MKSWSVAYLLLAIVLLLPGSTAALQQSPADLPATPDPSECDISPMPIGEFKHLLEQAIALDAAVGTPTIHVSNNILDATPADPATSAVVTSTVRTYLACFNAGDLLTGQSLVTREFLLRQLSQVGGAIEYFGGVDNYMKALGIGEPSATPVPELRGVLLSVGEIRIFKDGRLVAVVQTEISPLFGAVGVQKDYYVFREVDGDILIDDIIPNIGSSLATPTLTE